MNYKKIFSSIIVFFAFTTAMCAQQTIVINDPQTSATPATVGAADESLIKQSVLPKARKLWTSETCEEAFNPVAAVTGAFTRAGAKQTLVFYEYCQTGNGFGNNGLALIENGKIIGSYAGEGGWALDLKRLPDINKNGLDEFAVYYSGGMHQGAGGSGVDIFELSGMQIKGIGWYQADSYGEAKGDFGYKVTVKPGASPVFYREKYITVSENKYRKSGKIAPLKLGEIVGKFSELK